VGKKLPLGHIATNPNEIGAHGHHCDLIAPLDRPIGAHQVRVNPHGDIADGALHLKDIGRVPLDASGNPMRGHNY
jgi:hypothetical protein